MQIDPSRVTLRPGYNPEFINIDYDNEEIGHLRINAYGRIIGSWADNFSDLPLVNLIARCSHALGHRG